MDDPNNPDPTALLDTLRDIEADEKPFTMSRKLTDSPRLSVSLTRAELTELQVLASRSSSSASALGQLAIKHLLIQTRAGALPMLPPLRFEDAPVVSPYDLSPLPQPPAV